MNEHYDDSVPTFDPISVCTATRSMSTTPKQVSTDDKIGALVRSLIEAWRAAA